MEGKKEQSAQIQKKIVITRECVTLDREERLILYVDHINKDLDSEVVKDTFRYRFEYPQVSADKMSFTVCETKEVIEFVELIDSFIRADCK